MNKQSSKPLLAVIAFLVGLLAITEFQFAVSANQSSSSENTLTRDQEPVIMKGSSLMQLNGQQLDEIFVYAYKEGALTQIPAQIDEVNSEGKFVAVEDGQLDKDDELVFMSKDSGDQLPEDMPLSDLLDVSEKWYEVKINNPLDAAEEAWVYVVHSTSLKKTFTDDYVKFGTTNHLMTGQTYRLRFATPDPWVDSLTLFGGTTDLLDRNKSRLDCDNLLCPITEESAGAEVPDDVIKDGPVRAIIRNGRVLGYGEMLSWSTGLQIPAFLLNNAVLQFSLDFSPAATGSTFYSKTVPSGVIVDGVPDSVQASPVSPWVQLSSSDGTIIQVADLTRISGDLTNYYEDDSTLDPDDTGDMMRYGATGVIINNPDTVVEYIFNIYILAGSQPNRGSEFEAKFNKPLKTMTTVQTRPQPETFAVFLPFVER